MFLNHFNNFIAQHSSNCSALMNNSIPTKPLREEED